MPTAQDHYDALLAQRYSWMMGGDFRAKAEVEAQLLGSLLGAAAARGSAMDLGCGPGFQCAALASLGHDPIVGLDTSQALIAELKEACSGLPVTGIVAGIEDLRQHVPPGCTTIVCMGDTLTHLPDEAAVRAMLADACAVLAPGGRFIATWRPLDVPLEGTARFIPVRSDRDRIFTCFLEWGEGRVLVHDLVHERDANGAWSLHASAYPKLILPAAALSNWASDAGFGEVAIHPAGRMTALVGTKC